MKVKHYKKLKFQHSITPQTWMVKKTEEKFCFQKRMKSLRASSCLVSLRLLYPYTTAAALLALLVALGRLFVNNSICLTKNKGMLGEGEKRRKDRIIQGKRTTYERKGGYY